jgi:hypothetical protein
MREAREGDALALETNLVKEVPPGLTPLQLWQGLTGPGTPRARAAFGMALATTLFPGADPGAYAAVSGVLLPQRIPIPLMAADSIFCTAVQLSLMNEPAAGALALDLLTRFARSDQARSLYFRIAPSDLAPALDRISRISGLPIPPDFPCPNLTVGSLPFARPAGFPISTDVARMNDWAFLDASGRPADGGSYAWDRTTGSIYPIDPMLDDDR